MNKLNVREFSIITLGTAIVAASIHFIMEPSHMILGSIAGLAIMLETVLPLPVSVITFILNLGLLLLGFLLIGREFGAKTVYAALLLPVLMGVLEIFFPNCQPLTGDSFVDMICYLFVVSVGQAILFAQNASSGGLDIVAKILNKFFRIDLGKAVSAAGLCVAVASVFIYDRKTVVLAILGTYINGMVLDHFIFGTNIKRRVCIISNKQKEILSYVLQELHSGATIYEAKGAYSEAIRQEVIVIVDKNEYRPLMNYLHKVDPDAFVTVYNVNEVLYKPKIRLP